MTGAKSSPICLPISCSRRRSRPEGRSNSLDCMCSTPHPSSAPPYQVSGVARDGRPVGRPKGRLPPQRPDAASGVRVQASLPPACASLCVPRHVLSCHDGVQGLATTPPGVMKPRRWRRPALRFLAAPSACCIDAPLTHARTCHGAADCRATRADRRP